MYQRTIFLSVTYMVCFYIADFIIQMKYILEMLGMKEFCQNLMSIMCNNKMWFFSNCAIVSYTCIDLYIWNVWVVIFITWNLQICVTLKHYFSSLRLVKSCFYWNFVISTTYIIMLHFMFMFYFFIFEFNSLISIMVVDLLKKNLFFPFPLFFFLFLNCKIQYPFPLFFLL